jgi:hypothetical protein
MDQHKKERLPGEIFPDNVLCQGKGLKRLQGYAETFPKVLISSADLNEHKHAGAKIHPSGDHLSIPSALAQTKRQFSARAVGQKNKQVPLEFARLGFQHWKPRRANCFSFGL